MPRSSQATRAVVLVGALATIATSTAVPDLTETRTTQLLSRAPRHVRVVANPDVTGAAETLRVTFRVRGGLAADIELVPDDPALPTRILAYAGSERSIVWVYDENGDLESGEHPFTCVRAAPCEVGFTIEVLSDEPSLRELGVEVVATSRGEPFAETANLEIIIDGVP